MQSLSNVNAYQPNRRKVRVDTLLAIMCSLHTSLLYHSFHSFVNTKFHFLFLFKSSAGRSPTIAGAASLDVHMICMAFIIGIIYAFCCLTVDADGSAGMDY